MDLTRSFALVLLTIAPLSLFPVCTASWTGVSNDGHWDEAGNWNGCVPGLVTTNTDSATIGPQTGSVFLITLDSPMNISPGLSTLTFNSTSSNYTITTATTNKIIFNGASTLNVNGSTSPTLIPVVILGPANLIVNLPNAASSLTMKGGMDLMAGASSVAFDGLGTATFLNDGTFASGIAVDLIFAPLTLNGPTVFFQNSASLTTNQTGVTVFTQAVNVNAGTAMFTNIGALNGAVGVSVQGPAINFILAGGAVEATNFGSVTAIASGVDLLLKGELNAGTWTSTNFGTINSLRSIGVFAEFNPVVFGGAAVVNSSSGLIVTAGVGAQMEFNDFGPTPGLLMTGGTLTNSNSSTVTGGGTGALLSSTGTISLTGGTILNTNSGHINTGSQGSTINAAQLLVNGASLTNTNSGAVDATSTGSLIQGITLISVGSGGIVNNSADARTPQMTVNATGTVFGTGRFDDIGGLATTTFTNNGLVAPSTIPTPGGAPGTLNIGGTFTNSGTLLIDLLTVNNSSLLNITGASPEGKATLGGNLELALSPGALFAQGSEVTILQTTQGVIGTFNPVINFNLPPNSFQVLYFPNSVVLRFLLPIGPGALGAYADSFLIKSGYINLFEPAFASTNHKNFGLQRRMGQLRKRFAPEPASNPEISQLLVLADPLEITPETEQKQHQLQEKIISPAREELPWTFYLGPTVDTGKVDRMHKSVKYNYTTAGAMAGFDYAWSQAGMGLMLSYDHVQAMPSGGWGHFNVNKGHGTIYATFMPYSSAGFVINTIVGGGYDQYQIRRKTGLEDSRITTQGSPHGAEFDALLGFEYCLEKKTMSSLPSNFQLVPLLSLQYIHAFVSHYKEHQADILNLKYRGQHAMSLRTTLGARINTTIVRENYTVTPEFNLAWQQEYMDRSRKLTFSAVDFSGSTTSLQLGRAGRQVFVGGFDILVTLYKKYGIDFNYNFEWNEKFHDHFFYVGADFNF